jgi:Arc/MetJ family transcription regulator
MYSMVKRTTIELDEELLARAKRALGRKTTRETVEEALRLATDAAETQSGERAAVQMRYFEMLGRRVDVDVLRSEEMWR